ncbi:MAG: SPOR domain-containing protein [bacterium]|nr:SPOR domain-containing protein [candidate division KSB1 bacterium]MDH7560081.1 SPOR domain-containing protein [bacterium]
MMSRIALWTLGALLGLTALVAGCATTPRGKESTSAAKKVSGVVEDWDPASLKESEPAIPVPEGVARPSKGVVTQPEPFGTETAAQPSLLQGYRVQIISTPFEEVAREVRKEAVLKFEEPVYMVFDAPYYKVRVGDCLSRFEAEELQQKAIEKGFGQAWVVRTMVTPGGASQQP